MCPFHTFYIYVHNMKWYALCKLVQEMDPRWGSVTPSKCIAHRIMECLGIGLSFSVKCVIILLQNLSRPSPVKRIYVRVFIHAERTWERNRNGLLKWEKEQDRFSIQDRIHGPVSINDFSANVFFLNVCPCLMACWISSLYLWREETLNCLIMKYFSYSFINVLFEKIFFHTLQLNFPQHFSSNNFRSKHEWTLKLASI